MDLPSEEESRGGTVGGDNNPATGRSPAPARRKVVPRAFRSVESHSPRPVATPHPLLTPAGPRPPETYVEKLAILEGVLSRKTRSPDFGPNSGLSHISIKPDWCYVGRVVSF